VVKPFGHQELAARVQALLRRSGSPAEAGAA
jgi:DNA-binding response OmpR family regulator